MRRRNVSRECSLASPKAARSSLLSAGDANPFPSDSLPRQILGHWGQDINDRRSPRRWRWPTRTQLLSCSVISCWPREVRLLVCSSEEAQLLSRCLCWLRSALRCFCWPRIARLLTCCLREAQLLARCLRRGMRLLQTRCVGELTRRLGEAQALTLWEAQKPLPAGSPIADPLPVGSPSADP